MTLALINCEREYELVSLCMLFFGGSKIEVIHTEPDLNKGDTLIVEQGADYIKITAFIGGKTLLIRESLRSGVSGADLDFAIAGAAFPLLCRLTGVTPPWGLLTGVRPVKLYLSELEKSGEEAASRRFLEEFLVKENKLSLLKSVAGLQRQVLSRFSERDFSLYVSIPFCPTRCRYCSFVSHSVDKAGHLIEPYVELLCREIHELGEIAALSGRALRTVYFGGGTPTTLTPLQLGRVTKAVADSFDLSHLLEYTVEAGRPDTIDYERLSVLKSAGVGRLSVNPQSMNDEVLKAAGRPHRAEDIENALALVNGFKAFSVNMDLIAGLGGDTCEGFLSSLRAVIALCPENITVHSLTIKRAADLRAGESSWEGFADSITLACDTLSLSGYSPYYLYRQKSTPGNLENTGYTKPGDECLYNILIMDESHTILSAGAGGVSKLVLGKSSGIERVFGYKYPYEYINHFDSLSLKKMYIKQLFCEHLVK